MHLWWSWGTSSKSISTFPSSCWDLWTWTSWRQQNFSFQTTLISKWSWSGHWAPTTIARKLHNWSKTSSSILKIFQKSRKELWRIAWGTFLEGTSTRNQTSRTILLWTELRTCWVVLNKWWDTLLKTLHIKEEYRKQKASWWGIRLKATSGKISKRSWLMSSTRRAKTHRCRWRIHLLRCRNLWKTIFSCLIK